MVRLWKNDGPYTSTGRSPNGWWTSFGSAVTADDVAAFADALGPHVDDAFAAALHALARDATALGAPMKAMTD
jgi:hypothetical protein